MKNRIKFRTLGNGSISNQLSNSVRPFSSPSHSALSSIYHDSNPPPTPVDQFVPCLNRKLKIKRTDQSSNLKQSCRSSFFSNFCSFTENVELSANAPAQAQNADLTNFYVPNKSIQHKFKHDELEQLFDEIASGSCEEPLNKLIEDKFRIFFRTENVSFFHDIASVSALYCPTTTVVCPHGSGLIGYCHFSRQILNIPYASSHVSFTPVYDGKICQHNSRLLLFPLMDYQSHVRAVVVLTRPASLREFDSEDEKAVEYLQTKFQIYSRWLFQPATDDSCISEFVQSQRLGFFIENTYSKLQRLFNCKAAEIWEYNPEEHEIHMFVPGASMPLPVPLSDSGVVGCALSEMKSISLISSNTHSAYNKRTDGRGDQSLLVIPVKDSSNTNLYGIVLRGKRLPQFFTDIDQKILAKLAPIIVASLHSSEFVEKSYQSLEDSVRAQKRLQSLLAVAETLSGQLHIDQLIPSIMNKACDLVKADRCSLFMINENRDKLVTSFHGGLANAIEIPINAGIVGFTATTGQILNIKDVYEDPRFNRATDLSTGYRTHNLLCVPIFDDKNEIRGVTEMINKLDGVFTKEDEKLIQVFNIFVGISIENARLYRASIELSLQLRSVLEISQSIAKSSTMKKLCEDILKNSRKVIGAGRAMIYLLNEEDDIRLEMFAIDEDIDMKIIRVKKINDLPVNSGNGGSRRSLIHKMIVLHNPQSTKPGNQEGGGKDYQRSDAISTVIETGQPTLINEDDDHDNSIIISPIKGSDKKVLGTVVMQWKKNNEGFTESDLAMLENFSIFISISIERSKIKDQSMFGTIEDELKETFTEEERNITTTTNNLKLSNDEIKVVTSRSFNPVYFDDFKLIFAFFDILNIRTSLKLTNEQIYGFIFKLRDKYTGIQLHDWNHAKETAQFLVHTLANGQILGAFTGIEKFLMLIACLSHDVDYISDSNMEIPLSLLYNNKTPLESHHVGTIIQIIQKKQSNIFKCFEDDQAGLRNIWRNIIELIQSTNMFVHFDLLEQTYEAMLTDGTLQRPGNRILLMSLFVKMCDISMVARPIEYLYKISDKIANTFLKNADLTKVATLTPEEIAHRDELSREKSLHVFFNSVCVPIFKTISMIFPNLHYLLEQVHTNMDTLNIQLD